MIKKSLRNCNFFCDKKKITISDANEYMNEKVSNKTMKYKGK